MTQFQLRIGDETKAFDVARQGDRLHVTGGESAAEVRILHRDGAVMLLEITHPDGERRRVRVAAARQGDKRLLHVDGRAFTAERVRRQGSGPAAADASLAASIPAVVSQILVAVGDSVAAGDKLILLESMKMVIPILAPHPGRVSRIHFAAGDSVPAGVALLEIEPGRVATTVA